MSYSDPLGRKLIRESKEKWRAEQERPYRLLTGDAIEILRTLPAESVHCVVTSPPYWGLRDYGAAGQIGLEENLDAWVARMGEVFADVRRVLRSDGTLWLNLGDAYAGSWGAQSRGSDTPGTLEGGSMLSARQIEAHPKETGAGSLKNTPGLKNKDLMGQPWRVAFALQAAGWYLRSDIVWSKPAPMPESITDRPTKSHEYLFLLAKSDRYFYDNDAIREPYKPESIARRAYPDQNTGERIGSRKPGAKEAMPRGDHRGGAEIRNSAAARMNHQPGSGVRPPANDGTTYAPNAAGRNRRSVWTISSARFDGANFATFPEELVEPCVMAGTSEGGCCSACGAPRVRVVERGELDREHQAACGADANGEYHGKATKDFAAAKAQDASATKARILAGMRERRTVGWEPSCECGGEEGRARTVPCTVLDPFSGSATTGAVALRLGRHYVGIEINPKYQEEIARPRLEAASAQGLLRFNEEP